MKVLLVNPANRSYVVMPSLGLGYLASVARQGGHSVSILNCLKENMSYEDFADFIKKNPFDLIGFQVFSYDLNSVRKYLDIIKSLNPGIVTVAGGAHPSGDPEGTMGGLPNLDYAFKGEAETGFPMFLDKLESDATDFSTVPGLIFRKNGNVYMNSPGFVNDLDSLQMPAWDIVVPESYPEAPHGAFTKQFPTAPIIITRGCPFKCTFCAGKIITGPKVRRRSAENVIEELAYLKSRGIREFHIEDENFTAHRNLVLEFCDLLLKKGLGMSWSLPAGVRIDSLNREVLVKMEAAGCYSVALGIEFGSQRVMDLAKKKLTVEMVREKLQLFKGLDIKTTGFFLMGIPGETLQEMRTTAKFALDLPIDRAQFNNFMPLPGSELGDLLLPNMKVDWDKFFVHDVAYADEGISPEDIKRIQRTAYLRFYLRPHIMLGLLREVKSLRHLKFLFKRFIDSLS